MFLNFTANSPYYARYVYGDVRFDTFVRNNKQVEEDYLSSLNNSSQKTNGNTKYVAPVAPAYAFA